MKNINVSVFHIEALLLHVLCIVYLKPILYFYDSDNSSASAASHDYFGFDDHLGTNQGHFFNGSTNCSPENFDSNCSYKRKYPFGSEELLELEPNTHPQ